MHRQGLARGLKWIAIASFIGGLFVEWRLWILAWIAWELYHIAGQSRGGIRAVVSRIIDHVKNPSYMNWSVETTVLVPPCSYISASTLRCNRYADHESGLCNAHQAFRTMQQKSA